MNITAIDFETANYSDVSICAVGLAVFQDGQLTESPYWLVRPPKGFGWFREDFTKDCHGLTWFDVQNSPEFPAIAPQVIERLMAADIVVAHNAEFDMRKFRATLEHFAIAAPAFDYLCTLAVAREAWPGLSRHTLDSVTAHIGHQFKHHHAGQDAEAAGRVILAAMKHAGLGTLGEVIEKLGLETQQF